MEISVATELKVLIVEDEPRLREMLTRAVREMGFAPVAVRAGEDALKLLAAGPHDVLMVDLNLPGIGGLDLLARARERWPGLQAIVLTGYGDLAAAKRAIHLDVVDFLTKPCPLGEIESALERARRKIDSASKPQPSLSRMTATEAASEASTPRTMEDIEREHILATLARHGGNRGEAAAELGISVRKLYYRLAEYQQRGLIQ